MRPKPLVALLTILSVAAFAQAHGAAEANELEVEVLVDDANEFNDARGGWDVTQVFIGEAHDPELGRGPDGDAIYWRAELYGVPGGASPLAAGEWLAVFTLETETGEISREIRTTDGKSFTTDFDRLRSSTEDGIFHVERALIRLADTGLEPGMVVKGFRIETYVGGELRDRAPGGIPLAGPLETPDQTERPVDEYAIAGPTRYAAVALDTSGSAPVLKVESLLKKGSQHVDAHLPRGVSSSDPTSVSVKPRETASFTLLFTGDAPDHFEFDVTTDVGGRIPVILHREGGQTTLLSPGSGSVAAGTEQDGAAGRAVPGAQAALLVGLLGVAALAWTARRRT